jgi:hypothetical protein
MSGSSIAGNAREAAELAGIDPGLLDESLRLNPEQRAVRHQAALDLMLEMERAGRELRERTEQTAAAALRR